MSRRAYHSGEHSKRNRDLAKPQTIGSHSFDTQAAAVAFIQEALYRHPLLEPIRGADHEFLLELLKKHPRKTEKSSWREAFHGRESTGRNPVFLHHPRRWFTVGLFVQ